MEHDSQTTGRRLILIAIGYAIANACCVLIPFIPGLITFICWGFLFPLLGVIGTWCAVSKGRRENRTWWKLGIFVSTLYFLMGLCTVLVIAEMWASV